MGRKRHSVKTGDKSIYNSRQDNDKDDNTLKNGGSDDDVMADEVERFHNHNEATKDILHFDDINDSEESDEEDGMTTSIENVLDIESNPDENNESESDVENSSSESMSGSFNESVGDEDSDDDEEDMNETNTNILDWGKRKKDYYNGDTADLEIGQNSEDAELEEMGAKEVVKARIEDMKEDDFLLDDLHESDHNHLTDREEGKNHDLGKLEKRSDNILETISSVKRKNLRKLSRKDKLRFMEKVHSDVLPLLQHFRDNSIRPCARQTLVVLNALFLQKENASAVGATQLGLDYLLTKALLQISTALNACQFLLLKSKDASGKIGNGTHGDDNHIGIEDSEFRSHPVVNRLNILNDINENLLKIEKKVPGLKEQLEYLKDASLLMESETCSDKIDNDKNDKEKISYDDDDDDDDDVTAPSNDDIHHDSELTESHEVDMKRKVINEARFSLRNGDDDVTSNKRLSKFKNKTSLNSIFSEYGDEDEEGNHNADAVEAAGKSLASTINSISQRIKSNNVSTQESSDAVVTGEEIFENKIASMDSEIDKIESDDDNKEDNEDIEDSFSDNNDFYTRVKKNSVRKREIKNRQYAVKPKYPKLDSEIEGERGIGQMIMKNRGLVAHKNKLNRNPRVKKREQYRKALIRRKGAVRELRTDEGHKYGGEETGIKSGISRSRKLGSR